MTRTHFVAILGLLAIGIAWNSANTAPRRAVGISTAAAAEPSPLEPRESARSSIEPSVKASSSFALAATAGTVDPQTIAALARLAPGQAVVFSMPDGAARHGEVRLVRHDGDGWTRIGGLLGKDASFSLSTRDGDAAGRILLPREGRAWHLRRTESGAVTFVERPLGDVLCLGLPRRENQVTAFVEENGTFTVPLFDSRPSATAVLYLDFDGATVQDPDWVGGNTIVAPHARMSAKQILNVCKRVAGDYASFNINISTDAARYASTAVGQRMRAIITRNDVAAPDAGGVAFVDSFAHDPADGFSSDIPCWVFEDFAVDACAEALSHELGHTLGLEHDGRDFPGGLHQEYYPGHGRGATGWAPIMGIAYYRRLSQWSKGEYQFADNQEDDIAIIAGAKNGFGFVADVAGGTPATAASLAVNGTLVDQTGVIRNAQDIDVFRFTTTGGKLSLRARPGGVDGNIDLRLELLDGGGTILQSNNPKGGLAAILQKRLTNGTYFIRVSGTGKGDPLRAGYTNYGSIGEYRITGKINGLPAVPFAELE
jgi:hypothetical protein